MLNINKEENKKMKMKKIRIHLFIISCTVFNPFNIAQTADTIITKFFQDSYQCIKFMRHENGVYIDALNIGSPFEKPAAIVANGVGLISLCIADSMYKKTGDPIN